MKLSTIDLVKNYGHIFRSDYTQDANCKGAWLFKEGSGNVDDSSSNSNTGVFASSGHPAWASMSGTNAPSYAPYRANFDGSDNDYIDCGNNSSLNVTTSDFSVGGWINAYGTVTGDDNVPFCRGQYAQDGWFMEQVTGWGLQFAESANPLAYAKATTTIDGNDTWRHFWGVRSTNTIILYINGVAEANYIHRDAAVNLTTSTKNFYIGRYNATGAGWLGSISESGFFDKALNSTEINEIYDYGLAGSAETATIKRRLMMGVGI